MHNREQFWHSLNMVLHSIPNRNFLAVVGDMNTSLPQTSKAVGIASYLHAGRRVTGPKHSDWRCLHQILTCFDLLALNAWTHTLGPTYAFHDATSRIDFFCIRRALSDHTAKQVVYWTEHPLIPVHGPLRVPMLISLPRSKSHTYTHVEQPEWNHQQKAHIYNLWRRNDSSLLEVISQLPTDLQQLSPADIQADYHCIHRTINAALAPLRTPPRTAHPQTQTSSLFKRFAMHTHFFRTPVDSSLRHVFHCWFHTVRRQKIRAQMNQHAKETRRLRIQTIMDHAKHAATAHDHKQFFQMIRKLPPKMPYRRIQLRSDTGQLLSPGQAADALADWITQTFDDVEGMPQCPSSVWPFTQEDLMNGLLALPAGKSLAPSYAPAPIWKMLAEPLSHLLQPVFDTWFDYNDSFPRDWQIGTVTYLTKPGRACSAPADLRPISLLEPVGKSLMGAFANSLLQQVWPTLRTLPQLAYLPGRGGAEALQRVARRCRQVRAKVHTPYPIHNAATGHRPDELRGGLLVGLDLSSAFDVISRTQLMRCLSDLQVAPELIAFLSHMYRCAYADFFHRGQYRIRQTFKGIRQGCRAAPFYGPFGLPGFCYS